MKYKIGAYGSAVNESEQATALAKELGQELAKQDVIVVTGACTGMPYIIAHEAKQHMGEVWGFAPTTNRKDQENLYPNDDITIYDRLFYIPKNYPEFFFPAGDPKLKDDIAVRHKYRNVISTANVDAGIIVSGRWGTMHEFSSLHDMGKVIGILTGTGGVADEMQTLYPKFAKHTGAVLVYDSSPKDLIKKVLEELDKRTSS